MSITVRATDDPATVLDVAGAFLRSRPVLHNVILTLLHGRVAHPEPGRYWMAVADDEVVGVTFQSPHWFFATVTPMADDAVAATVDAIAAADIGLPGVNGEAATVARFAGQWTERRKSAAAPDQGQRIYEVRELRPPTGVPGRLRRAEPTDRALLVAWMEGFQADTGERGADPTVLVDQRLPARRFWLWENGEPTSMAATSDATEGVVRIQAVYTPPEHRECGYASAGVATVAQRVLDGGDRCILYTDLGNPTSNSVYRRIGFRAVAEALRYRFE